MSINEKDPNQNYSVPLPAYQPIEPSPQPEPPRKKSNRQVIIVSAIAVVLIGGLVALGLVLGGAFSKDKKSGDTKKKASGKETSIEETEDRKKDNNTSEKTDPDDQDQSLETSDDDRERVTSLSQITDEQYNDLLEYAVDYYIKNIHCNFPSGVEVKAYNCLGFTMEDLSYAKGPEYANTITVIFQLVAEDESSEGQQEKQIFWFMGVSCLYQDGTINSDYISTPTRYVCFDNWYAPGFASFESMEEAGCIKNAYESNIETSYILPVNGKPYEPFETVSISSLSELSSGQLEAFDDYSRKSFEEDDYAPSDLDVTKMELKGYILAANDDNGMVIDGATSPNYVTLVYEIQVRSSADGEEFTYYWYRGYPDPHTCGEVRMGNPLICRDYKTIDGYDVIGLPDIDVVKEDIESKNCSILESDL